MQLFSWLSGLKLPANVTTGADTVGGSKFSSIDYVGRARKSHALKKHVGVNWCPYEGYPAGTHKK